MSIIPTSFWWMLGLVLVVQALSAITSWLLITKLTRFHGGLLAGLVPLVACLLLISDVTAGIILWIGVIFWMSAILFHETPRVSAIAGVIGLLLATASSLMLYKGLPA